MIDGYFLKVAEVNLSKRKVKMIDVSEEDVKKFIGGSGLGAKLLFEYTDKNTDPLSPENALIFMTGPFAGTKVPCSDRYEVITKSPYTGIYAESDSGGHWAEALKRAGVMGLVIIGKADKPVYLMVTDDEIKIEDADDLWGKDTWQVDEIQKEKYGRKAKTVCIGVAGENLVRFAAVMNDGIHGRAAGRAGCGTVMGSKNLKAITAMGTKKVPVKKEEEFNKYVKELVLKAAKDAKILTDYGTSCGIEYMAEVGDFPIKNWYLGDLEGHKKMTGQHMADTILVDKYHCGRCPIGCGRVVEIKEGKYKMEASSGPEYETIGMLGSNCMVTDLKAISKGNELCNKYGLDTISTGALIAFCMEAYERGLVSSEDTGGIELKFGDPDAMLAMIKKIALREDIGNVLADGILNAAEKIGGNSIEFAMHVKGLDFPAHDPRAKVALGVSYATSNRGACHLQSFSADFEDSAGIADLGYPDPMERFTPKGKGKFTMDLQNLMSLFDSLRCCKFAIFGGITVEPLCKLLNLITGWDLTKEEFLEAGERIYNLKRLYNVRLGISRKDDTLPPRVLNNPRGGGSEDNIPILNEMLRDYYIARGWDEFGIPTRKTLERLGLSEYHVRSVPEMSST
jgi:aldehyde:ferredoxin oxidoreductase